MMFFVYYLAVYYLILFGMKNKKNIFSLILLIIFVFLGYATDGENEELKKANEEEQTLEAS